MKKTMAIILVLCLCVGLCACGGSEKKSAAVIDTENAISAIGEVTLESKGLIEAADALYNALTDNEKEKVSNRATLVLAHQTYDELEEQKRQALISAKNTLLSGLSTAQSKLSFVAQYAGNVNASGKRKFADSFLYELKHCLDDIDLTLLEEEIPGITEDVAVIKAGCLSIHDMLVDMGNTNSGENVGKIKNKALDVNQLVTVLMNGAINNIK